MIGSADPTEAGRMERVGGLRPQAVIGARKVEIERHPTRVERSRYNKASLNLK